MDVDPLAALWQLAARQHQAFAVRQAIELGVARKAVERLHRTGQVPRLHQGVYAAPGSVDSPLRRASAALLAVRGSAVLSHQTAVWLHGLTDEPPREIHLLRPMGSTTQAHSRVVVHHTVDWAEVVRRRRGLQVAAAERCLRDVAASWTPPQLRDAMARGVRTRILTVDGLAAEAARRSAAAGIAVFRAALDEITVDGRTDSPFESDVRRWLRRRGFRPAPGTFPILLGTRVVARIDIPFPAEQVGIECDSRTWHSDPRQFERDRRRWNDIQRAGWRIVHLPWRQFTTRPEALAADLQALGVHPR